MRQGLPATTGRVAQISSSKSSIHLLAFGDNLALMRSVGDHWIRGAFADCPAPWRTDSWRNTAASARYRLPTQDIADAYRRE
jgi:hypothetical protein